MWRLLRRTALWLLAVHVLLPRAGIAQVDVSLPAVQADAGTSGLIPIEVTDLTGLNVTSFQFTVVFDATVVDITGASNADALTEGTAPLVNTGTPGQATVAWASATPLSGGGVLVYLEASYINVGTSALTFTQFDFNEGTPASNTTDGSVTVGTTGNDPVAVTISGALSGNVGSNLSIPVTVGDVTGRNVASFEMVLEYDPAILRIDAVAQAGTLTDGTPASANLDTPGQVSLVWASATPLSGEGTLIAFEATLLAAGTSALTLSSFKFNEGAPPATLQHGAVTVLADGQINVSMPTGLSGSVGQQLLIPVETGDLSGRNVTAYSFTVTYNAANLTITGVSTSGTLSDGHAVVIDTGTAGQATVSAAAGVALGGAGTLVHLVAELTGAGESTLNFSSFQFNDGNPAAVTSSGSVSVSGEAGPTFLQIIHNSPDAPAVDIYINDVRQVDALAYGSATAFLELESPIIKLDVVDNQAPDNANPITSSNVSLLGHPDYVAVINGLYAGSGKQAIDLVVSEAQQEANDANTVGLLVFQGSPDAPPINVYIVDDTPAHNRIKTLAKSLGFGEAFLSTEFEPGVYNIEITQSNGPQVGVYRADLSRTGGAALLFMITGFMNPIIGQPELSVAVYAPDGRAIFLPISTDSEEEAGLPASFRVRGNYPNPFNPATSIEFDLPEAARVTIDVFDMLGRHVLSLPEQQYHAGNRQTARLDASELASGTYVYRVLAEGQRQRYASSQTMTLMR